MVDRMMVFYRVCAGAIGRQGPWAVRGRSREVEVFVFFFIFIFFVSSRRDEDEDEEKDEEAHATSIRSSDRNPSACGGVLRSRQRTEFFTGLIIDPIGRNDKPSIPSIPSVHGIFSKPWTGEPR